MHQRAGPLRRLDDLVSGAVEHFMIEGFHANPNFLACLACHGEILEKNAINRERLRYVDSTKASRRAGAFLRFRFAATLNAKLARIGRAANEKMLAKRQAIG
jgi:hypothetical protein